jgi:hypothetical protein
MNMAGTILRVRLPDGLAEKLDRDAREFGIKTPEFARLALARGLMGFNADRLTLIPRSESPVAAAALPTLTDQSERTYKP